MSAEKNVLITGSSGYIGSLLVDALVEDRQGIGRIVATDIRLPDEPQRHADVDYVQADIRSPDLAEQLDGDIDVVVHLAAIVTPGRQADRSFEYSVDVLGTKRMLDLCLAKGVDKFIVTSSGAAYGYYADNPEWLDETDAIRGNVEFAYSDHKRLVEEMLARYREQHPELKQLIFRPGTIFGDTVKNQITALFEKPFVLGLRGSATPFVLIWDRDVVGGILEGIKSDKTGIYNMAGDGVLTMKEMAEIMGKPYVALPVSVVRTALWAMKRFDLTRYGPEQVDFLRYRPVLKNDRLKREFGYVPQKTTREVFDLFVQSRR